MKKRLAGYALILPLVLLLAYTDLPQLLSHAWMVAVPGILLLLLIAFLKTKALTRAKKCLILLLTGIVIGTAFIPSAVQAQTNFKISKEELEQCTYIIENYERIPRNDRTLQQQMELEKARVCYREAMRERMGGSSVCATPRQLMLELRNDCWLCDLFYLIIESMDKVVTTFYAQVQDGNFALSLLAIGFFIWIIMRTLALFTTLGMGDIGQYFTDLFKQFLIVVIVSAILYLPFKEAVNMFITPFFTVSSTLTQELTSAANSGMGSTQKVDVTITQAVLGNDPGTCSYCTDMQSNREHVADERISKVLKYQASLQDRVISSQMRDSMLCTVCNLYQVATPPVVVGQYLSCMSRTKATVHIPPFLGKVGFGFEFPNVVMWLTGTVLICVFWLLPVIFSFYLVEAFFRIGFVLVLLPFEIVAAAFKSTRSYTKRAWDMLVYSLFSFFVITLALVLIIQIFYTTLGPDASRIASALSNQDAKELMDIFGPQNGFIITVICIGMLFLSLLVTKSLDDLCASISGVHLSNSGGMGAVTSMWGTVMATTHAVSAPFNEKWEPDSDTRALYRKDAARRGYTDANGVRHGAPKYHSLESRSRGTRRFIYNKADQIGASVEKGAEIAEEKIDTGIKWAETGIKKGVIEKGYKSTGQLFKSGTDIFKTINGATWYMAPLQVVGGLSVYAAAVTVGAATVTAHATVKVSSFILRKTSAVSLRASGWLIHKGINKAGRAIAYNKYITKTTAFASQTAPSGAKATAGLVATLPSAAVLGASNTVNWGYSKLTGRPPKAGGKLDKLNDKARRATEASWKLVAHNTSRRGKFF